jgi:hypothetical protein
VYSAPVLLTLSLVLIGCPSASDTFPPPLQRQLPAAPEKKPVGWFVNMDDPNAEDYIVSGIQTNVEGSGWRWTHEFPELRFVLDRTQNVKFAMDFGFPEYNFKQTGPVTLSFFVNGKLLDKVRYATFGDRHYEKPVPAAWLKTGPFTEVRIVVDPPWVAPVDKARLGFVLHRAGFVE